MKENSEKDLQALEVIIVHILSLRVRNYSLNILCIYVVVLCRYRIVPSKRRWALAAQVPKFEDGQLHGERA